MCTSLLDNSSLNVCDFFIRHLLKVRQLCIYYDYLSYRNWFIDPHHPEFWIWIRSVAIDSVAVAGMLIQFLSKEQLKVEYLAGRYCRHPRSSWLDSLGALLSTGCCMLLRRSRTLVWTLECRSNAWDHRQSGRLSYMRPARC